MDKEEFLRLRFFKEQGFVLKKCKVCGKEFWTLDSEREVCGDQPCVDYEFVGRGIGSKFEKPSDVREAFLRFFEREGHTRVKRYPVVARWREDVYLVGASIYDFQPWVTEGIVEPPANPLVISQPSIRLTDLENVGRSGRHLTGFEMMAHHAFNIKGRNVYWADETVRFAFRVLTEIFKIPPEDITFKFDWWSGGGNAGEDYEVLVKGLEIATLVFMHYKIIDDKIIPMQNKIVDTGYGLERLLWLFKGSPTVYDAIFSEFIEKMRSEAGIAPIEREVALAVARKSGKLDFKKPLEALKLFEEIARSIGMDIKDVQAVVTPYYDLYALLDHTRTLMWMIGDGIVPSNVEAGYLARLLVRRSLRHLWKLGIDRPLAEVVAEQIEYWKDDFPEYVEMKDEILDIIDFEEKRFRETLQQGKRVLRKMVEDLKLKGCMEFPSEKLVELYDSHGVPPEVVEEEMIKLGVSVSIPADFYLMLVSRHQQTKRKEKSSLDELSAFVEGLEPTEKLYYADPRLFEFDAKVVKSQGSYVVLDRTAFYPEGGGQLFDTGVIEWNGGSCRIVKVVNVGGVIVHVCDGTLPPIGARVKGRIDVNRRLALMRSHTGTHIVLGAARRVLGRHVWQAGAQKDVDQSRLDITHHKRITPEELRRIEMLANSVVMENRPVRAFFENRSSAEIRYGFTLYQGGVVPGATLRIVEIEGWDVEACGGLHCSSTGEVGPIKIIKVEKIQDGVSRITFKVGESAIKYVQDLEESLNRIASLLNTEPDKALENVKELLDERNKLSRELKKLKSKLLDLEASMLAAQAEEIAGMKLVVALSETEDVKELALKIAKQLQNSIIGIVNMEGSYAIKVSEELVKSGLDARRLNAELLNWIKGRGGGASDLVTGKISEPQAFVSTLKNVLLKTREN